MHGLKTREKLWADALQEIQERLFFEGVQNAQFAAYKEDGYGIPVDNLDQTAISGLCYITKNFFYPGGQPYCSFVIYSPTWLDLCKLADDAIVVTNDYKHPYLEGVTHRGAIRTSDNCYAEVYSLEMGS